MFRLSVALLLAAVASAQTANYTTTAWMTNFAGSDKYGYVASVINADAQHMTLSLDFDTDTDREALHIGGIGGHWTFGASSYTIKEPMTRFAPLSSADMNLKVACTQPAQSDADVTCNGVFGDGYARFIRCNEDQNTRASHRQPSNYSTEYPHTYGTGLWGSGGTETITNTINFPLQTATTTPAWCTSDEVPTPELTTSYTTSAKEFAVYQIVIYAGQEKLSAYSGSSVVVSTASGSTGSAPAATASAGSGVASASATASVPPESTGAAGTINAVVSALGGMVVAAIMGML
ncbi:hypothetical protein BU25DRAFT_173875 [Macroventuria anomochaeta]|uniref:Uncharacterized protein n=1 Tax=Macroventuria anomochaeta TaxID=301207 RepID=A0ACB6RS49_9PLEO|nr:uncharacterized protein BU25DRAFT_173875 [Macroventuria anomochaeta]KAF2623752.1 hypothetical protein BU25DRAFT_173875 [Macroventuria anomochaeta]